MKVKIHDCSWNSGIVLLFFLFYGHILFGQGPEDKPSSGGLKNLTSIKKPQCEEMLEIAQSLYNQGQYEQATLAINGICLSLDRNLGINGYELLARAYTFIGDEAQAGQTLKKLLRLKPDFQPSPTDPIEFINLFNRYRVIPAEIVLSEAQKAYDEGRLDEVLVKLRDRLQSDQVGMTKPQASYAWQLVVLSYLFMDSTEQAKSSMLQLLTVNPRFRTNQLTDPPEMVNLIRKFRTQPLFFWGGRSGLTYTTLNVFQAHGISPTNNRTITQSELNPLSQDFSFTSNFTFGITAGIPLPYRFEAVADLLYSRISYSFTGELRSVSPSPGEFSTTDFTESQSWIDMPVYLRYKFRRGALEPYTYVGLALNVLLNANMKDIRRLSVNSAIATEDKDVDILRNNLNVSALGGLGFKYNMTYASIEAEIRYMGLINNLVNTDNRYSIPELIYDFGYVDSDFGLNNFALMIGFSIPFYKPKLID